MCKCLIYRVTKYGWLLLLLLLLLIYNQGKVPESFRLFSLQLYDLCAWNNRTLTNPALLSCSVCSHNLWILQRHNQHRSNATHPHEIKDNNILTNKVSDHIRKSGSAHKTTTTTTKTYHRGAWRSKSTAREALVTSFSADRDNKASPLRQLLLPYFLSLSWIRWYNLFFCKERGWGEVVWGGPDFSRADTGLIFSFNANNLHQ